MENAKIITTSQNKDYDPSLFKVAKRDEVLHDQAFETKPISYLRGALKRFAKNRASIVAAVIILLITLYAIIVPIVSPTAHVDSIRYPSGFYDATFTNVSPYNPWFKGTGFWDGTKVESGVNESRYITYKYDEGNRDVLVEEIDKTQVEDPLTGDLLNSYTVRIDTYAVGVKQIEMSQSEFNALRQYEIDNGLGVEGSEKPSILKPLIDSETYLTEFEEMMYEEGYRSSYINTIIRRMRSYYNANSNVYYKITSKKADGTYTDKTGEYSIVFDEDGEVIPLYQKDGDDYVYYESFSTSVSVRVDYFDYFTYLNGFEPLFLFGTNGAGQDLFLRLAEGTRFSLLLGIGISLINFIIGLIWGAISGYYGGKVDLIMERITDIISALPSVVILTICGIQFTNNTALKNAIGSSGVIVLAFLVAFVYSGWMGTASTTRMQFYRYKGQEYVLASRTLGAKDRRLIFKHILPNAAGTLVTSSVLMIPGVIFSESSLSYLGIISFSTSGISSIGTLLSEGQGNISTYPYLILFPCIVISLLMICFNLFGNGLRDAFNTSLRGSEE